MLSALKQREKIHAHKNRTIQLRQARPFLPPHVRKADVPGHQPTEENGAGTRRGTVPGPPVSSDAVG